MLKVKRIKSTRKRHSKTIKDPRQIDLLAIFDDSSELVVVPSEPNTDVGALSFEQKMRRILGSAITKSPLNREQIADLLTDYVGRPITKSMLDSFTGAGRPNRLPADLLPALTAVLGPKILLEIAAVSGCRLMERYDAQLARLGQLYLVGIQLDIEQQAALADTPLFKGAAND